MKIFWRMLLILASAAVAVLAVQMLIKRLHGGRIRNKYIDIPMGNMD